MLTLLALYAAGGILNIAFLAWVYPYALIHGFVVCLLTFLLWPLLIPLYWQSRKELWKVMTGRE